MTASLGLCIVGCGAIARIHARVLRHVDGRIHLYFASRDRVKAETYARRYGGRGSFGSLGEAATDSRIDAIVVCTPNHRHAPDACAALRAGKHVIVEKPMAVSSAEATEMNQLARVSGRLLMVAENHRYRPSVRFVQELLARGDLGALKYVRMTTLRKRLIKITEWRAQMTLMGGGPFMDGGVHWASVLLAFLGPAQIHLFAERPPTTEPGYAAEDSMVVVCRANQGAVGTLAYSWGVGGAWPIRTYSVHGAHGSVWVANSGQAALMTGRRRGAYLFLRDSGGFRAMWRDFLGAIASGSPPLMSGVAGARDVLFVERAYESATSGERRVVPPMAALEV